MWNKRERESFAQLRAGDIKFIGSSDSQLLSFEKPADNWSAQIDEWQSALSNLAAEFTSGHVSVEVYDKTNFGFQEHLLPLNRWLEELEINALVNKKVVLWISRKIGFEILRSVN
mgnify:CR=1 FL=1